MAIENGLREILLNGTANRQTIIHFPNGEYDDITSGIYSGSMTIEEILSENEELTFGECNASRFEVKLAGIDDISNSIIYVYQKVEHDENKIKYISDRNQCYVVTQNGNRISAGRHQDYTIPLFYGRVESAELQTDHIHRVLTAYDELYYKGDINCSEWYKDFFSGTSKKTLRAFRDSLFSFIGISQEETTLVNDALILEQTLETNSLSFGDIIKAICQINGVFGHINKNGIFRYVDLSNINDTYDVSDNYRSNDSTYETYVVKKINKLQIRSEEDDIGVIVGNGDNPYIIQGNFLIYGKSANELESIATILFNKVKNIEYRPANIKLIYSEPYITIGNGIAVVTNRDNTLINSVVLKNTLNGVQLFSQNIVSEGSEYRSEVVDDVNAEIYQIKGKTLKITKNIDEFSVQIEDLERGYSQLSVTVDSISTTVATNSGDISTLQQTATSLTATVQAQDGRITTAQQTADKIEWIVASGTSSSNFKLTDRTIDLISENINITGYVTFNDLKKSGKTTINGDNITTGSIDCNLISADGEYILYYDGDLQIAYGTNWDNTDVLIGGDRVSVCQKGAKLGFFGARGSSIQAVVEADSSNIVTAFNILVNVLDDYGLVEIA